ncbi:type-F conjugative transfer system protein TraW [Vibrio sp. S11_S32]|uniref:type-F conjugative transfer system protein TraW n=1 Tax=Vibrio sp. S11_S32 TaxID=2720225 RepID=UPI0016809587|nr:type-F conjugative transfer system protein TraW [Vibrio sp. S11_S32]
MKKFYFFAFLLSFTSQFSYANDLGVYGAIYTPIEIDMLDWIHARLDYMQKDGEWDAIKKKQKAIVKARIIRPKPVIGLSTTTHPRTYFIDPTMTLQKDIKDSKGNILYHAGLQINPFNSATWPNGSAYPQVHLTEQLAFFNGDDPKQVAWAIKTQKNTHTRIKWILTQGEPAKVAKQLHQSMYFDQTGHYCKRFSIQHIPVLIKQDHFEWRVQEFDVQNEVPIHNSIKSERP